MLNSANELNSRHKNLGVFALNVVIRVKLRTITAKKNTDYRKRMILPDFPTLSFR